MKVTVTSNVQDNREEDRELKYKMGEVVSFNPREGIKRRGELDPINLLSGLHFTIEGAHVSEHDHPHNKKSGASKTTVVTHEYYNVKIVDEVSYETVRKLTEGSYLNPNKETLMMVDFELEPVTK